MGLIYKLKHSFSAKLSFYVLLFSITIFLVSFFFFYHFSSRTITEGVNDRATNLLEVTKYRIENVFTTIKTMHKNIQWAMLDKTINPDSLYSLTAEVVRNNPYIVGCAVAFEPNYFPKKGYYFSPYSSRQGDTIKTIQLGTSTYDYFSMEWYLSPKKFNQPYWTDPYYDDGGGQMLMFTYSTPLYDSEGKFIGILTADVSTDWLTDMVNSVKPYASSYCVLLAQKGTYIIHPKKEMIMSESIFDVAEKLGDEKIAELGDKMIQGQSGMDEIKNTSYNHHVESYVYYTPLQSNRWSLGMIIHKDEVFEQLYQTRTITILLLIGGLILLFFFCMVTISKLTKPLRKFSESARLIAQGNFSTPLPPIHSKDEMKELHNSFLFMQKELANYISELQETTSKKERIESELRIASEIQMGMIPKIFPPFPDRDDVDLYALLRPAKEVGGDLYDFFIDNNKLYFTIGDVSGKGVPASLFMAVTRSLFRSLAAHYDDPAQIVASMNSAIAETNESNMFVTLFVGILHLSTGKLCYCNAGHNPPVVIDPEGNVRYMSVKPNIPVGIFDPFSFQTEEAEFPKGSVIFMYTDGLTEAEDKEKLLYTEARLAENLALVKHAGPQEIVDAMVNDVVQHANGAEQSDDLTLFVIQYKTDTHEKEISTKE